MAYGAIKAANTVTDNELRYHEQSEEVAELWKHRFRLVYAWSSFEAVEIVVQVKQMPNINRKDDDFYLTDPDRGGVYSGPDHVLTWSLRPGANIPRYTSTSVHGL